MAKTETSAESDKVQTRTSAGQGGRGCRGIVRKNTRDSLASTRKDYKEEIGAFVAVLTLKYEKV